MPISGPGSLLFLRKLASSSLLCRAPTSATPDGTRVRTPSADTYCPGRPGARARDTLCHTFVQRLVTPSERQIDVLLAGGAINWRHERQSVTCRDAIRPEK